MTPPLVAEVHEPSFLGYPRSLWYLAFTEAWERFSYYGMQSLLVLYMVKYLLLPGHVDHVVAFAGFRTFYGGLNGQALASAIFGTYTARVYLTPILGGFLADRLLGKRITVLLGALTMPAAIFSWPSRARSSPRLSALSSAAGCSRAISPGRSARSTNQRTCAGPTPSRFSISGSMSE